MKIIFPKLFVMIINVPVFCVLSGLLSLLFYQYMNVIFIVLLSVGLYILFLVSYTIIIKNGFIYAKDNIFSRKRKIQISEISLAKKWAVRSGESYLTLYSKNNEKVVIYKTFFSKKQIDKLIKYIKEYNSNLNTVKEIDF